MMKLLIFLFTNRNYCAIIAIVKIDNNQIFESNYGRDWIFGNELRALLSMRHKSRPPFYSEVTL